MSNYELMMIEQRGFRHGAGGKAMDASCAEHAEEVVCKAYNDGYAYGPSVGREANGRIARKHGVSLGKIKAAILR